MENTELQRHLRSFLQYSDAHLHVIAITKVSQQALGGSRKQSFALAFHSSLPTNLLLLWPTTSFAEAEEFVECCWGTVELLPWLLDTQGRTTRFSHSPDYPTIVFCLQHGDSAFLLRRKAGRYCCTRKLRASRRTLRKPQGSLALANFPPNQFFTMTGAHLSKQPSTASINPFFILAPTDYRLFLRLSQACLPPSISCR